MEFPHPFDPRRADARVEMRMAQAEQALRSANRSVAEQWWSIGKVLDEARESTELFVDPLMPMRDEERVEFSVRAAVADVAVRLGISETTVRDQAHLSDTLRTRMPRLWSAFVDGDVMVANARAAVELLASLPGDDATARAFDDAVSGIAHLAPVKFRARARVVRERIHSIPLVERAAAAREKRGVWIENLPDGMAQLILRLPAETAHVDFARIEAHARALATLPGETRTLAQLRADVAGDLLVASGTTGGKAAPRFMVGVTIPITTAAGVGTNPRSWTATDPSMPIRRARSRRRRRRSNAS